MLLFATNDKAASATRLRHVCIGRANLGISRVSTSARIFREVGPYHFEPTPCCWQCCFSLSRRVN